MLLLVTATRERPDGLDAQPDRRLGVGRRAGPRPARRSRRGPRRRPPRRAPARALARVAEDLASRSPVDRARPPPSARRPARSPRRSRSRRRGGPGAAPRSRPAGVSGDEERPAADGDQRHVGRAASSRGRRRRRAARPRRAAPAARRAPPVRRRGGRRPARRPAATAASVSVGTSPPNTSAPLRQPVADALRADARRRCPSPRRPCRRRRAMATMSGMRKFVRMPPISTAAADSRGKPSTSTPTSVDVPPTSATSASLHAGEEGGAAERVRRARADRQHRVAHRVVERPSACRRSARSSTAGRGRARRARPRAPWRRPRATRDQRRVEHGGVLALEQAERADLVRERDVDVGAELLRARARGRAARARARPARTRP